MKHRWFRCKKRVNNLFDTYLNLWSSLSEESLSERSESSASRDLLFDFRCNRIAAEKQNRKEISTNKTCERKKITAFFKVPSTQKP